jgi:hypothetical protein
MITVQTIEERNQITDAILCVGQPDGSWVVYQEGDTIPEALRPAPYVPE